MTGALHIRMTRLLALDVGEVRIGVAVSDYSGSMAFPYTILHVSRDEAQTLAAIQRLIEETEAEGLVVGLPISLDGQIHAQGQRIQAFVERLKPAISQPVMFWDERLSTVEAERLLFESHSGPQGKPGRGERKAGGAGSSHRGPGKGKRRKKQPELDDKAAAIILKEYLDHLAHEKNRLDQPLHKEQKQVKLGENEQ